MLFITNPEKHSLEIYKTTIKNNYKNIEKSTLTIISKPWVLNVVKIDSYNFDTYTQEEYFWWINYKFNNIIYSNKEDFDNALNKELGIKKQEEEKLKAEKLSANEKIEREKIEREKVRLEEQKNAMTKKLIKDFLLKTYLNK